MILKFPKPYPDETFYSWIARYHERSANHYAKVTVKSIYDSPYGCAIYNLPTGLESFCNQLLPLRKYHPEDILKYHTSLPYYSATFSKQRIASAKSKMLSNLNIGIHGLLGMQASTVTEFRYLRYCPDCLIEDTEQFGEPYWHRVHQLPGVLVCPDHHVSTLNSMVDKQNNHSQLYASAKDYTKPNLVQKNIRLSSQLIAIALESKKLLSHFRRPITSTRYRTQILSAGFNKGDLIDQGKLAEAFLNHWPATLLDELSVPSDLNSEHSWLKFITRRTRQGLKAHPLQHILLRLFLKEYQPVPQKEPTAEQKNSPASSYPCPNPFCPIADDLSAKLEETYQHHKSGPVFGVMGCECGFKFSANIESENIYQNNVLQYGPVWDTQFIQYVEQGHSIHKLEQLLSVSRPVIKKKAIELKLSPKWSVQSRPTRLKRNFMDVRSKKHKQIFLRYRKKHPDASMKELREKINSTIKFLYRYERAWLNQHRPDQKLPCKPTPRIDWNKRDQSYLEEVKSIVTELNSMPGKPQKLTPFKISRILGQKNIFTKIPEKLPLTMAYLEKACNKDEYISRTFIWAAAKLRHDFQTLTRSKILSKAGIRYTPSDPHEALLNQLMDIPDETPYQPLKNRSSQNSGSS